LASLGGGVRRWIPGRNAATVTLRQLTKVYPHLTVYEPNPRLSIKTECLRCDLF
jgi:hypothetical protein